MYECCTFAEIKIHTQKMNEFSVYTGLYREIIIQLFTYSVIWGRQGEHLHRKE